MSGSWERFRATLEGTNPKPIAAAPLVAADHAAHLAKLPVSSVVKSAALLAQTLGQAHERYQGDFLIVFADVNVEAEAMGCRLEFPQEAPPHVVETIEPEALANTYPHSDGRLPVMLEATASLVQRYGAEVPVFASLKDPFSAATLACGPEFFLTLLVTAPEKAHFAIGIALENQQRYLEALIETGANVIIGAPLASGGILGSRRFREFAYKPICSLIEQAKNRGRLVGIHSCGDADPILEDLIRTGADFLSLESFDLPRWKMLAEQNRIPVLMGYFPTDLFLTGTPNEIKSLVRLQINSLKGFPHIMATACDVPQTASANSVITFMQSARQSE